MPCNCGNAYILAKTLVTYRSLAGNLVYLIQFWKVIQDLHEAMNSVTSECEALKNST